MAFAEERRRRGLTARQLAERARLSPSSINALEAGRRLSLDGYARVAVALGMPLEWAIGRQQPPRRERTDLVHAFMGETEAGLLQGLGYDVAIDHPYQHFQFAGRADVVAWSVERSAMLHIENRTRFPNLQEAAGSFNAKRQYLARVMASQLGLRRFRTQDHVMVGLWSGEVMRAVRTKPATFAALCPDGTEAWESWLRGAPHEGTSTSAFILLDPFARGRQRGWLGLEAVMRGARPRMRGYADAARRVVGATPR
jgi:transcriptional regulator with XRE-family HTH domain